MSGHTPGPWEVGGQSGNPGEGLEIAAKTKFIAWGSATYYEDEDEDVITAEDRANAHLIAAAPELLAALKECREALLELARHQAFEDDAPEFNEGGVGHTACGVAIEAINKAEGRGE